MTRPKTNVKAHRKTAMKQVIFSVTKENQKFEALATGSPYEIAMAIHIALESEPRLKKVFLAIQNNSDKQIISQFTNSQTLN